MGCVYVATCVVNGKQYVGFTAHDTLDRRKEDHRKLSLSRHCPAAFHRALAKYGMEAFEWKVVFESPDKSLLVEQEIIFIKQLGTKCPHGYNMTDGGEGQCGAAEETRRKIGLAHRGKKRPPRTEEYRKKMSEANRRRLDGPNGKAIRERMRDDRLSLFAGPKGAELRRKIGGGNRGKKMSEEQKAKLREARARFLSSEAGLALRAKFSQEYKGRRLSAETRARMGRSRIGNKNAVGNRSKAKPKAG